MGDEDQTIYTFTGATSSFLTAFAGRWPGAREVTLVRNYRSTPQVLALANRLLAAEGRTKRLEATRGDGPEPQISRHASAEAELVALAAGIRERLGEGIAPSEVAVLVRTNAQLAPIEEALTRAGIAYVVRGLRFYDRPEVRGAVAALRRQPALDEHGVRLLAAIRERWTEVLGYEPEAIAEGNEAQERQASLDTLLAIVEGLTRGDPHIELAGGARGPRREGRPRAVGIRGRRQPPDPPPREGARVGRRVPAGPRGGRAADPPGDGR